MFSDTIKRFGKDIGFSIIGIAKAEFIPDSSKNLNNWLDNGYHASMKWMDKRKNERENIHNYFPEAKSVISVGLNYFSGNATKKDGSGKISNYAWGDDYHIVMKKKLKALLEFIQETHPNVQSRICVDTSPILDKVWAQQAGLGWQGKHTNLINQKFGSWIFLGELILDIILDYDLRFTEDLCGTCTECLKACPTNALTEYHLDSNKCISYLTIEHRGDLPEDYQGELNNWIYGCDICQEVCPWNIKFQQITEEKAFFPRTDIRERNLNDWENITEQDFKVQFKDSAIKRTKYEGLKRNILASKIK